MLIDSAQLCHGEDETAHVFAFRLHYTEAIKPKLNGVSER